MLNAQSRYLGITGGEIIRVPNAAGVYNLTVLRRIPANIQNFSLYTWTVQDRPDMMAYRSYNDPTQWWTIFDANPELIDPLNVPPGTVFRVPTAPVTSIGTLIQ